MRNTLYINVGGHTDITVPEWTGKNYDVYYSGGYNGDGTTGRVWRAETSSIDRWSIHEPIGGGATSIATESGVVRSIQKNNIIIVASGGGGAAGYHTNTSDYYYHYGDGGNGGGISGGTGTGGGNTYANAMYGFGATQSANGTTLNNRNGTGGGGGYYYGGGGYRGGAGGGSSYIGSSSLVSGAGVTKHMTCYSCTTSSVASTLTYSNTTAPAETPTPDVAKLRNGYAKITYISTSI